MNPCQMNALIAAIVNYLYTTLPKKEFIFWNVFFSELSKSMFGMEILRSVCLFEKGKGHHHSRGKHGKHGEHDENDEHDEHGGEEDDYYFGEN